MAEMAHTAAVPTTKPWSLRRGPADLDVATTLLANHDITVAEIAERVGVSPATLYRYLPAARTAHGSQL